MECFECCVDFLKEMMFNYNNGEIMFVVLGNDNLLLSEVGSNGIYEVFE